MIDRDVNQAALAIEYWLENRVVSEGGPRCAGHSLRGSGVDACITLEACTSQCTPVADGSAEIVERNSPDHAVVVIGEEARTYSVVETFLDGDEDALRPSANERKNFVRAGRRQGRRG